MNDIKEKIVFLEEQLNELIDYKYSMNSQTDFETLVELQKKIEETRTEIESLKNRVQTL